MIDVTVVTDCVTAGLFIASSIYAVVTVVTVVTVCLVCVCVSEFADL